MLIITDYIGAIRGGVHRRAAKKHRTSATKLIEPEAAGGLRGDEAPYQCVLHGELYELLIE